ncbi:MAG: DUF721 domain-containing protein [Planctomycetota bacterium]|nr:DUF721 domain-containing protein [Planctomycetota bacterium]
MKEEERENLEFEKTAETVIKKQRYRRKPKTANELVGRLLARSGYSQNQSQEQIKKIWEKTVGDQMKNKTRAVGIKGGNLTVLVESAIVNQEITYQKKELLEKIKRTTIGEKIKNIKFKIGIFK